jgi:uncharacterized heparinase superfamily protein
MPRRAVPNGTWTAPVVKRQCATGPREFCFLGRSGAVATAADWNDGAQDKLWLYNLHYFDDLTAAGAEKRRVWHRDLIDRWIGDNPPGSGNGWEPYPTSLRIVNWVKFALAGVPFQDGWLDSLALQTRWLEHRLERHLLGNHLFANAKALVFAGLFFDGAEATRWLNGGLRILKDEVAEQILADGGHFELSPMYHAIILEDVLDLINLARTFSNRAPMHVVDSWLEIGGPMRRWLRAMTHPDGEIAFFNDAAFNIAAKPSALEDYAIRLGLPAAKGVADGLTDLPQSGYIRWQTEDAVALLDVAAIGPDYLPGHAHADSLSFELSVAGTRVIVNGGTSTYGRNAQRQRERGTAAHSTVTVDDADSSEIWAGFRVARRARIRELNIVQSPGAVRVAASHDGYMRLGGGAIHRREWTLEERRIAVRDEVSGTYTQAMARFHLAPAICADGGGKAGGLSADRAGRRLEWRTTQLSTVEPSQWHPEFGCTETTACLVVPIPTDSDTETAFSW